MGENGKIRVLRQTGRMETGGIDADRKNKALRRRMQRVKERGKEAGKSGIYRNNRIR